MPLTISRVAAPSEVREIVALLREYTAWAFTLAAGSEQAPTFLGLEHELATLPGIYAPPTGSLLLATYNGRAAGCVALKGHDKATAELKRLYVRPEFRGLNIGRDLITAVVAEARRLGYARLILDSHRTMTAAHALYTRAGFKKADAPPDFPDALKPEVVFMEMELR